MLSTTKFSSFWLFLLFFFVLFFFVLLHFSPTQSLTTFFLSFPQVPRTSELYVHRCGRSARGANGEGLSLLLVGEKERDNYRKILYVLERSDDLDPFPVTSHYLLAVRERVKLARRLDKV